MKQRIGLALAFVVALAVSGYAQKTDFSGSWAPDEPRTATAGPRAIAEPMTVTQTPDALTVKRLAGTGMQSTTYTLDGVEHDLTIGQTAVKASAKWDGAKIVITSTTTRGQTTQTWSMDGGNLTIARTGGRGPSTTTYHRAS